VRPSLRVLAFPPSLLPLVFPLPNSPRSSMPNASRVAPWLMIRLVAIQEWSVLGSMAVHCQNGAKTYRTNLVRLGDGHERARLQPMHCD